jgi:hypothetical protein
MIFYDFSFPFWSFATSTTLEQKGKFRKKSRMDCSNESYLPFQLVNESNQSEIFTKKKKNSRICQGYSTNQISKLTLGSTRIPNLFFVGSFYYLDFFNYQCSKKKDKEWQYHKKKYQTKVLY